MSRNQRYGFWSYNPRNAKKLFLKVVPCFSINGTRPGKRNRHEMLPAERSGALRLEQEPWYQALPHARRLATARYSSCRCLARSQPSNTTLLWVAWCPDGVSIHLVLMPTDLDNPRPARSFVCIRPLPEWFGSPFSGGLRIYPTRKWAPAVSLAELRTEVPTNVQLATSPNSTTLQTGEDIWKIEM